MFAGFSGLMVLLIRFLASVIVWVILAVAIVGSIGMYDIGFIYKLSNETFLSSSEGIL